MRTRALWACSACYREHDLPLLETRWPAWARSELERERKRRRFEPTYGVSGRRMSYAPYSREAENRTYRRVNRVRRNDGKANGMGFRISADNLFYSTGDGHDAPGYDQLLEAMPADLREKLLQNAELKVILADAIRSLPLISQRAILGQLNGHSVTALADREGVSERMLRWLLSQAKQRLADLLMERMGADDGQRYV
jgi:DNA-directed RNA polymerase specialized sigma24 family protein